jgi:hypothetical protein
MRAATQILRTIGTIVCVSGALTTAHGIPEATVTFGANDIDFSQTDGYDILNVAGCHLAGEPGQPLLPCKAVNFVIPRGQGVSQVLVEVESKNRVLGEYCIYPAQPDMPSEDGFGSDFVGPDADIYGSDEPFPGTFLEEGETSMAWGWKTYQVIVWPLEYIPADREIWLYETVKISLELVPSAGNEQEILARTKQQHEGWAEELEQVVVNPEDVPLLAPENFSGVLGPSRWVLILPGDQETLGRDTWIGTFDSLIDHRQSQGLDVQVDYVREITTASGEAAVLDIRDYLKDQHEYHGAQWACLVGDHEMIPWTYWNPPAYPYPRNPNDWCYCDLDGSWPGGADWAPEIWAGRIPCITRQEGGYFVDKVLAYEQNPGPGDPDYLKRAFYEHADQWQYWDTCDMVIDHQAQAMQLTTLFQEEPSYNDSNPQFPTDQDLVQKLDATHYNYVTVHCHGFTDTYWPLSIGCGEHAVPGTSFGPDDVANLSDEGCYYFFWYSTSCLNAELDQSNGLRTIAEAATCMYSSRGAIAFAGYTRESYGWIAMAELQCHAWDALFGPFSPSYQNHVGAVEARSKTRSSAYGDASNYLRYAHNLFGDPATAIWTPQYMPPAQKPLAGDTRVEQPTLRSIECIPNPLCHRDGVVEFSLNRPAQAQVTAFDVAGRMVRVLCDGQFGPGIQTLQWNSSDFPSGTFLIRVKAGKTEQSKRIVIIR